MFTKKQIAFPFQYVNLANVGKVFYPYVHVNLHTVQGWRSFRFIVDTGADLTTLPRYMAPILGIDLNKAKNSSTGGIGGSSIKTWETTIPIRIQTYELSIRCSITDDTQTPFLLGRVDLLEKHFSWYFDSRQHKIVFEILHT